jgi:hypothetical protein
LRQVVDAGGDDGAVRQRDLDLFRAIDLEAGRAVELGQIVARLPILRA